MKKKLGLLVFFILVACSFIPIKPCSELPFTVPLYSEVVLQTKYLLNVDDTIGVQVPIPQKDRIYNKTGIQCVWCSIETIARYAEIKELFDLTERSQYKSRANSSHTYNMLVKFKVRFQQQTNKDTKILIQACKVERRGVAFGVRGHMMTLVHFDPENDIVKYIDNGPGDKTQLIRTWTMKEFMDRWTGWAIVVYRVPDLVPSKYKAFINVNIIDKTESQRNYNDNYIPEP